MSDGLVGCAAFLVLWLLLGWRRRGRGVPNRLTWVHRSDEAFTFTTRAPGRVMVHLAMVCAAVGLFVAAQGEGGHFWGSLGLFLANIMIVIRIMVAMGRAADAQYAKAEVVLRRAPDGFIVERDGSAKRVREHPQIDIAHNKNSVDVGELGQSHRVEVDTWGVLVLADELVFRVAEMDAVHQAEALRDELTAWLDRDEASPPNYRRPSSPLRRTSPRRRGPPVQTLGALATVVQLAVILADIGLGIFLLAELANHWSATTAVLGYLGPVVALDLLVRWMRG